MYRTWISKHCDTLDVYIIFITFRPLILASQKQKVDQEMVLMTSRINSRHSSFPVSRVWLFIYVKKNISKINAL